jgi:L-alanine-DL-glutamate epimerase-like enolase superfamily enzyme
MGRHGPVSFALAGIDIALGDLAGKIQGAPIHRLLGGATRDRIPTYASLLRYGKPDLVARYTAEAVAHGYTAVKLHEHLIETIAPGREAAGADIAIMVDTNCAWAPDQALETARGRPNTPAKRDASRRSRLSGQFGHAGREEDPNDPMHLLSRVKLHWPILIDLLAAA